MENNNNINIVPISYSYDYNSYIIPNNTPNTFYQSNHSNEEDYNNIEKDNNISNNEIYDHISNKSLKEWSNNEVKNWLNQINDPNITNKILFKKMKSLLSKKTGLELSNYSKRKLNDLFGSCGIKLYNMIKHLK